MRRLSDVDEEMLRLALLGLELQRERIEAQLKGVRAGGKNEALVKTKRVLSAAAKKRMATAQKKRWAAVKKAVKQAQ